MNALSALILWGIHLLAGGIASQNWNTKTDFFNITPQVGGTTPLGGDLFAGVCVSYYTSTSQAFFLGAGGGAYAQGDEVVGEALVKTSLAGIFGASVGPSFSGSGGVTLTNDLWANAIVAGLRWRMDHRKEGTIHSVALMVPLGLWLQK